MRCKRLWLAAAVVVAGCTTRPPGPGTANPSAAGADGIATPPRQPTVIVTPATGNRGRISSVNPTARHAVVTYPLGIPLPLVEQRLYVYRAGLKVAELKVSKERIDVNLVADITSGECRPGDEVRSE